MERRRAAKVVGETIDQKTGSSAYSLHREDPHLDSVLAHQTGQLVDDTPLDPALHLGRLFPHGRQRADPSLPVGSGADGPLPGQGERAGERQSHDE